MITGKAATSVADHLFSVRDADKTKFFPEEKAIEFHHTTAQFLLLSSRARRDIQTAVSFLTIRVKKPDEDAWRNLKRALKYLNGTRRLKLILTIDSIGVIKWFIYGSHNTHWDFKGPGSAMVVMVCGAISSYSRRMKVNTRSSTETELVLVDAYIPEVLWYLCFIQAQIYWLKYAKNASG